MRDKDDKIRSFISIELIEELQLAFVEAGKRLSLRISAVSWVKTGNFHLTLKFLGEIEKDKVAQISAVLTEVSSEFEAFDLRFGSVGAFPSFSKAKVIWIGVKEGQEQLKSIASRMEMKLSRLGFSKEKREFTPHLTLGRLKIPAKIPFNSDLERSFEVFDPVMRVENINLMRSELHSSGAIYAVLGKFPLPLKL